MNQLPVYATDLVRELDKTTPARCIGANESLTDAHRYAGKRELIDGLLRRLEATNSSDPTKPLLGNRNVHE
jgi:hypothetical protein